MEQLRKKVRDPNGNEVVGVVVDIVEANETTSVLRLEDGVILRVRPIILEVVRVDKPSGEADYLMEGQLSVNFLKPVNEEEIKDD